MTHELKPCPCCDGEAELDTSQGFIAMVSRTLSHRAAVYCTRCGLDMGFCYDDAPGTPPEDIVDQVVDDWNRRALSAAKSEPVAVLHSDIIRKLQLLMESFCAYGGDAVPSSVVERARTLHAQLSALASEPANG